MWQTLWMWEDKISPIKWVIWYLKYCLFSLSLSFSPSADRGRASSQFRQKTFLINWPPNCVAGLNLRLDNLIALLHLNLFFPLCSLLCQISKTFLWTRLSDQPDLIMAQSEIVGGMCVCRACGGSIKSSHLDCAKKSSLGFDKQIMSFCVITPGPQISEEINQRQPCR